MKATTFYAVRRPLVRNCNGRPFVWFNSEKHRFEISHGTKLTIIQLTQDAYPVKIPWEKRYRGFRKSISMIWTAGQWPHG